MRFLHTVKQHHTDSKRADLVLYKTAVVREQFIVYRTTEEDKMMRTSLFAVIFLVVLVYGTESSYYPCRPCIGDECDLEPEGCRFGTARDPCGRLVCAAGPGERCGGRDNHLGKCGDGMYCRCGTCKGCSTVRFLQGHIACEWSQHMCNS